MTTPPEHAATAAAPPSSPGLAPAAAPPSSPGLAPAERATAELARLLAGLLRDLLGAAEPGPHAREQALRFVLACVFAMFAEHTGPRPGASFTRALADADASQDLRPVWTLLDQLGAHAPLFAHDLPRLPLTAPQIHDLHRAARDFPWSDLHPEIFGSIFEQALHPARRHQLGAHFSRAADIARVVGPSVVRPWQARIAAIRTPEDAEQLLARLRAFHVLDPACGCGNFLYVVYREMKRLEAALARQWIAVRHPAPPPPGPWFTLEQLHGLEIDPFAAMLARLVLGLGERLAARELGLPAPDLPGPLDHTVRHADALQVDWPRPAGELAIVGNPPYLGVRKLRRELGDERVQALFARHPQNRAADYVTYWFTRALEVLRPGERAGYVCTNSIAQNHGRAASIDPILAAGGTITDAWRSYPWPGEAAVHVGIVNWVMAPWSGPRTLEGRPVRTISPGLSADVDVTVARRLEQNTGLCFMGVTPGDAGFVLTSAQRAQLLAEDPGSDPVIRPFLGGRDINRQLDQRPSRWVIDFGLRDLAAAQAFTGAFHHLERSVFAAKHAGAARKTAAEQRRWWQFVRPRPQLQAAIAPLPGVLVIPCLSPHLIVSRQGPGICFDHQLMVLALGGAYHLGVLQSRLHAIWARARGSTLKRDLRYTNTTIFETFPFPPPSPTTRAQADRVADAAETFDRARTAACHQQQLGLTKIHNQLHNQIEAGAPSPLRDAHDALNDAVTACYGFPPGVWRDDAGALALLLQLNLRLARP